jgi:hypothetical protein
MNSDPQANDRNPPRKRRRHGYRGYGSPLGRGRDDYGGAVHWGRGFAGLGIAGAGSSALPPDNRLIPEDLHESLSRAEPPPKND